MNTHELRRADLLKMLGLALVYALLVRGALKFFSVDGIVSIVYPTVGVSYAVLLLTGRRYWPAVLAGELLGDLVSGLGVGASFALAIAATAAPWLAAWLLTERLRFDPAVGRPRDFATLMAVAVGATAVGALIGTAILWVGGEIAAPHTYATSAMAWWQGDITGVMLLTPLLLVWRHPPRGWLQGVRALETAACFGLALVVGAVVYMGQGPAAIRAATIDYWPFLFVTWAAVRFGRHGALAIVLITALQALLGALQGSGLYAADLAQGQLLNFWLFMTVLAAVGLTLALAIHGRDLTLASLHSSQARLQHLMTATPVVIYTSRIDGDYGATFISDNVGTVTGHAAASFLADAGFWARHVHPDDAARVMAEMPRVFERRVHQHEYRFRFNDGSYHWMSDDVSLVRDGQGRAVELVGCWLDITERKRAEEQIRAALRDKELLLKEIYHRVKNNLQVIASLLNLQGRNDKEGSVRALLEDSANRIKSMALVHEQLYQGGDLSSIDFAAYLGQLVRHLADAHGAAAQRVPIRLEVVPVQLGIETAVPLGLIINELLSNAYKHAYPGERGGEVVLRLAVLDDGRIEVVVSDRGVGLPAGLRPEAAATLGMRLVSSLTEQLDGTFECGPNDGDAGSRFAIRFKPVMFETKRLPA